MAYREAAPANDLEQRDGKPLAGKERVDTAYSVELKTAGTLGELKGRMKTVVQETGDDAEAKKRATELEKGVDAVAATGTDIKLADDLGESVLANHHFESGTSNMGRNLLTPEAVTKDTRLAVESGLHEHNTTRGHRGQDANARLAVITRTGERKEATVGLEGNVVTMVARDGRVGGVRDSLPEDTYKEGVRLAQEVGVDKLNSYARKGGANQGKPLQFEIWRKADLPVEEMVAQGAQLGIEREEVLQFAEHEGRRKPKHQALAG